MNAIELRRLKAQKLDEAAALAKVENRALADEERTKIDALLSEAESLEADAVRMERIEGFTSVTKPQGGVAIIPQRTPDTERGIFCRYLRSGDEGAANELRAYNNTDANITTAADGEVTVPVGMVQDIMARRDEMSLIPKLGLTRVPGKGTTVNFPIDGEADVIFASVAESGEILQDLPAMSEKAFTLVKYGKHITITWELLEDEDVNLLAFFNNWIARGLAATQNSLLITEALANGTAGLTLDAAAAIGAAEIPELVGKLMPEYQNGSQWIMHPTTFAYLAGLASSSVFTFAPQPGGNLQGTTLWGYPVNQSSYATALAASAKSLIFGNFSFMGYREAPGLTVLRDPYTGAHLGQLKLWFWFRTTFGVTQAEAIQYATHPSA